MNKLTQKLTIQTTIIAVIILICGIFGFSPDNYNFGHLYEVLWLYSQILLVVFVPITLIYFIRYKKNNLMLLGRLFRFISYFSIVVIFLLYAFENYYTFYIRYPEVGVLRNFWINTKIHYSMQYIADIDYGLYSDLKLLLPLMVYLIIIGLFLWAIKVNKALFKTDEKI